MKQGKKALAAVSVIAVAGLLASCAADSGSGNNSGGGAKKDAKKSITISETNALSSLNSSHADFNLTANSHIAAATKASLITVTPDKQVKINKDIGNVEKVSDNPLKVKYTVNEEIKWSDGNAMDAGDLLLAWASGSAWHDDAKTDDAGKVTSGNKYFNPAGDTTGLNNTKLPEISEDGRSMTIEYTKPFADWQIVLDLPQTPAHVVAKHAGLKDEKELVELLKTTPKGDPAKPAAKNEKLAKVADAWTTPFNVKSMPSGDKADVALSSGPFKVSDIQQDGGVVVLVRNDKFGSKTRKAKLDEIIVKKFNDAQAQIQALKNGELQIAAPQATAETIAEMKALEKEGVQTKTYAENAYDHIDLRFDSEVFKDKTVREAFMKTVPRKAIFDKIVGPLDPNGAPVNSALYMPDQKDLYSKVTGMNGSKDFAFEPDIEGAKKLLAGKKPKVRILYSATNKKRIDIYTLVAESATKAGFEIENGSDANWSSQLGPGKYDASIFAWISDGVGVSGVPQIYKTGAGSNHNRWSNKEADKLMEELVTTVDEAKQHEIKMKIDKMMWDDRYGLPLFQNIGVMGLGKGVKGVPQNPGQLGPWVFVEEWDLSN